MDKERQELIFIVKENGKFELDFRITSKKLKEEQILLQNNIIDIFKEDKSKCLLFLASLKNIEMLSQSIIYLKNIIDEFLYRLSKNPDIELLREKVTVDINDIEINNLINKAPYLVGSEHLDAEWIRLFIKSINNYFSKEIVKYKGSISEFFSNYNIDLNLIGHVFFHLVESKSDSYPFAFLATYSVYNEDKGTSKHLPLKNALIKYGENNDKLLYLLSTVNKAASKSELIANLVESGEIFYPIGISATEAYTFLKEINLYEESGILCRIPKWWRNKNKSLKLSITVGDSIKTKVNSDALIDFDVKMFLDDKQISEEDIKQMLLETEGLALIKGKWVEVDHKKLNEILETYKKAQELSEDGDMSIVEALKFKLTADKMLGAKGKNDEIEVTNGQWLNSVIEKLSKPNNIESITCGNNFNATLRHYQEKGVNWLNYMKKLGLGACLADDMGLGKTIQVIALLNYIKTKNDEKTILVVPASLIGNWVSEINKFAPMLKYYVLHSSENKNLDKVDTEYIKLYDVFITTYSMVSKYEWLKKVCWDTVIIDEAQAIKNSRTKQTKSVKELKAKYRIAMTGTPIENRLSDLWSLFDFLNKGLLGSSKEFIDFTKRLKENQVDYSKLKNIVNPFILRRVKTDKSVISDLPEKIEMKTYVSLSKKQVLLYSKIVKDLKVKLESSDAGIQRKGIVISSIMKFKQLCNHPSQYLGQELYEEKDSGKFTRLKEICETIYENRERVIVFTQFKEMTQPLGDFLETVFQHKGLILHGGTAVKKRKKIIEQFQGDDYVPYMILSIKAGGVGLNLTAANHVIHFDRWWNPAVENQATDRAFRIGQNKNVVVHKFITKGTIEEKIDLMIDEKIKLSNEIISDNQENWITEMSNNDIMKLFELKI